MERSNRQLLKGLKNGDIRAFEMLHKEYYALLCYIAEHTIRNADDAEEIVSDVFVKLWNNRQTINITSSIKAYLIRAVRNTAINYIESRQFTGKLTDRIDMVAQELLVWDKDYPLGQLYRDEIIKILNRGIGDLPKGCREIFMLSRNSDLSYDDIAFKLGISTNTVKSQMKVALSRLRELLKEYLTIFLFLLGL